MPPILILGATKPEISGILSRGSFTEETWSIYRFYKGTLAGKAIVVGVVGVGKVISAAGTFHALTRYKPCCIIMVGIAGSLSEAFSLGDILIARDTLQWDLDALEAGWKRGEIPYKGISLLAGDPGLIEKALSFPSPLGKKVKTGRVLTGDTFLTCRDKPEFAFLRDELQGDAVDMEGAAVAFVADLYKTPFLLVRIISDRADGVLPEGFKRFLSLAADLIGRLIFHILN